MKPEYLKDLKVVPIHELESNITKKYSTRYEIRNRYGQTILSDDIPRNIKEYIVDKLNDTDLPVISKTILVQFKLEGKTAVRRDSKLVMQNPDGTFALKHTKVFYKWLAYHKRKRKEYFGTWAKKNITHPVNVEMVFYLPLYDKDIYMHEMVEATLICLKEIGVLGSISSSTVQSIDGTRIVRTKENKYATIITITKIA